MIKKTAFVFLLLLLAHHARADEFVKPTFAGMLQTMLRMNALTLNDDHVLDDYAIVTECDLYKAFYADDFKWHQVRATIRDSVKQNLAIFPTAYIYDYKLQLDRYDFTEKLFRFTAKTAIRDVNAFGLYTTVLGDCPDMPTKSIPTTYRAVLDAPVSLAGLPLDPAAAKALLKQMTGDGNDDRIIYARFNLRVVYIEPLHANYKARVPGGVSYEQPSAPSDSHAARFDARLDSIDFYEDKAMTRLVYTYRS